ncbi:unnamed protein product [Peniophora sp. CBMAI 1063]|nr:unnamed protein product [Peniophora sp. CBMAI 1063]
MAVTRTSRTLVRRSSRLSAPALPGYKGMVVLPYLDLEAAKSPTMMSSSLRKRNTATRVSQDVAGPVSRDHLVTAEASASVNPGPTSGRESARARAQMAEVDTTARTGDDVHHCVALLRGISVEIFCSDAALAECRATFRAAIDLSSGQAPYHEGGNYEDFQRGCHDSPNPYSAEAVLLLLFEMQARGHSLAELREHRDAMQRHWQALASDNIDLEGEWRFDTTLNVWKGNPCQSSCMLYAFTRITVWVVRKLIERTEAWRELHGL